MFTFSAGFEAATLKIPNKEYNAYGGTSAQAPAGSMRPAANGLGPNYSQTYSGSNDPYNLVTVNQGGVVVDGGRDGTMASWPATVPGMPQDDAGSHFVPGGGSMPSIPPRKQIIGFAKFRSRSEALEARDVLQGRRVDIEKGAVLKAEMAKKNLHTKRGVGPLPLQLPGLMTGSGGGLVGQDSLTVSSGVVGMNGMTGIGGINNNGGIEAMSVREREMGALGAMGLGGLGQWRDSSRLAENDEERERRRDREAGVINAMGLGAGTRGPRERAEEDDRERERRWKEKERMRSANLNAFDAFHSVPPQTISRHPSNSLLSGPASIENSISANSAITNGFGHVYKPLEDDHLNGNAIGPWDAVALNGVRKASVAILSNPPPIRPPSSSRQSSPPSQTLSFSPHSNVTDLPLHHHHLRSHMNSPPPPIQESVPSNQTQLTTPSSEASSSASSVVDGPHSHGFDSRTAKGPLAVTIGDGNTSPQLPSPVSGASSTSTRNVLDQNPPVSLPLMFRVSNLLTHRILDQHALRRQLAHLTSSCGLSAELPRGQPA